MIYADRERILRRIFAPRRNCFARSSGVAGLTAGRHGRGPGAWAAPLVERLAPGSLVILCFIVNEHGSREVETTVEDQLFGSYRKTSASFQPAVNHRAGL